MTKCDNRGCAETAALTEIYGAFLIHVVEATSGHLPILHSGTVNISDVFLSSTESSQALILDSSISSSRTSGITSRPKNSTSS